MIAKLRAEAKYARKALVAALNLASLAVSQAFISGTAAKVVGLALAFATIYGVYSAPNASRPPSED